MRLHVFFSGRVQGVFFRANTKRKADELCVNGWVRNLSDGRVEAVFEGDVKAVNALLEYCLHGQPYAKVREYTAEDEPEENIQGFRILH